MPECTCRGGNPNCSKCGGWGWLGDSISAHRAPPKSGPLSPVKSAKYEIQRRKSEARAKRLAMRAKKLANAVTCPFCSKKVNDLDMHVSVVHDDKWAKYVSFETVKTRIKGKGLKRCKKCGALFHNIEKHVEKVHNT